MRRSAGARFTVMRRIGKLEQPLQPDAVTVELKLARAHSQLLLTYPCVAAMSPLRFGRRLAGLIMDHLVPFVKDMIIFDSSLVVW